MKIIKFLWIIGLFLGTSIPLNAQLNWRLDSIIVNNQYTTLDTITIKTTGWIFHPEYGYGESTINVVGDSILISIELRYGAEPPIDVHWTVPFTLDPLGEGKYIVKATGHTIDSKRLERNTLIDSFLVINTLGQTDNYFNVVSNVLKSYPNPAKKSTTITFIIKERNYYNLKIYNSSGQEVRSVDSVWYEKGEYSIKFNLEGLPSGIYYYTLKSSQFYKSGKIVKQ